MKSLFLIKYSAVHKIYERTEGQSCLIKHESNQPPLTKDQARRVESDLWNNGTAEEADVLAT
jgi:hypothetical protein